VDIDDRKRHALYRQLETVLGPDHADTMMALLPPVGWADVATKTDLAALEGRLGARIDGLETRLDARIDRLEARTDALETSLHARIDGLETGLGARIDGLETGVGRQLAELRAEFHQALRHQVWAILGVLVVAIAVSEALGRLT